MWEKASSAKKAWGETIHHSKKGEMAAYAGAAVLMVVHLPALGDLLAWPERAARHAQHTQHARPPAHDETRACAVEWGRQQEAPSPAIVLSKPWLRWIFFVMFLFCSLLTTRSCDVSKSTYEYKK